MAGEWVGKDGKLHGPHVCPCHRVGMIGCPDCAGSGTGSNGRDCLTCFGSGRVREAGALLKTPRVFLGLLDPQGYPLCLRCKSRIEDPDRVYCPPCAEMARKEWNAAMREKQ